MDRLAKFRATGYALAVLGLVMAASSLLPAINPQNSVPWPLFVGSFVYLHGGFLVVLGSRGPDAKAHVGRLRFVRLGFVAVVAILVMRLVNP